MVLRTTHERVRRIGFVKLRTLDFNRGDGRSFHPIWVMYLIEHVVVGLANHAYDRLAFGKEH